MAQPDSPQEVRRRETQSLFGEILDWMLAPLLFLWPISIVATNHVANQIANIPYDRQLAEHVVAISKQIQITGMRASINLPGPARDLLRADEEDRTYFQVLSPRGEVIVGDNDIPRIPVGIVDEEQPMRYRNEVINNEEVRVAYLLIPTRDVRHPVIVQVAETRHKREQMASRIISGVLLPQFAIIPLAVILVWVGLTRGLEPIKRLQTMVRRRRSDDLSPIPLRNVPDELHPMISAFNDMMSRLDDNLDAQHRFIAAAAHQLKTPLTGLKTQVELAIAESDPEQLKDYLRRIAGGVDRAAHLTAQLLQLARAEASHDKHQPMEIVELSALAHDVTAACVPRALKRNIDLGIDVAGAPVKIIGVSLLLREMLDNLVDNAIKYTPPGGRVTVRMKAGHHCLLEVEDTGIGIPQEERSSVFDRFYRVLGTGTEGSGLGLAIVREIAVMHRASIEVLDGPSGLGTLIRLNFPITKA